MTNIRGSTSCVYEVEVEIPPSLNIIVEPRSLAFKEKNDKASYIVRFERKIAYHNESSGHQEFGQIWWKCLKGGTQVPIDRLMLRVKF